MTEAPKPGPGETARGLIRAADRAVLSTSLVRDGLAGWPYGSLVLVATDHDLSPLLLISDLADHTRNIAGDPRVSLLVDGTAGLVVLDPPLELAVPGPNLGLDLRGVQQRPDQ